MFSLSTLDVTTLSVCFGILSCLQCIAFFVQSRINRSEQGLPWWTLGSASMFLGFMLNLLRENAFLHEGIVVLYNLSFVVGVSFVCIGIYRFEGRKIHFSALLLINILAVVAILYYTYVEYDIPSRRTIVSLGLALLSLLSISALGHPNSSQPNGAAQCLKLLFGFNAVWLLAISGLTIFPGFHAGYLNKPAPLVLSYLLFMLTSTLWTFGLIILVNQNLTNKLLASKIFLESTLDGLSANIALLNERGDIVLVNKAWRDFAVSNGLERDYSFEKTNYINVCNESSAECVDDASQFSEGIRSVLSGAENLFTMEYPCHSNTEQRWFVGRVTLFPGDGPKHVVVAHEDITKRKLAEIALEESNRKLALLTNEDGLTKIANRRHFDHVLAHECSRHARNGATLSLILLDIDFFKNFNDTYGHVKGDECLQHVAMAISQSLKRPTDLAARYGGEEFACLLPETNLVGAVSVAESIRQSIEQLSIPHGSSKVASVVTVSVGLISQTCEAGMLPTDVVRRADELLYQAKSEGRNRVAYRELADVSYAMKDQARKGAIQISWNAAYASGNERIDEQHMLLVTLANEILKCAFSGNAPDKLMPLLENLLMHVEQHFKDEESILRKVDFPNVEQHIAEHNRLLQQCAVLIKQHAQQPIPVVSLLQYIIHDLVMQHMFRDDMEYYPYVTS